MSKFQKNYALSETSLGTAKIQTVQIKSKNMNNYLWRDYLPVNKKIALIHYLLEISKYQYNTIDITPRIKKSIMENMGIVKQQYSRLINELKKMDFIRGTNHTLMINPEKMFNGYDFVAAELIKERYYDDYKFLDDMWKVEVFNKHAKLVYINPKNNR